MRFTLEKYDPYSSARAGVISTDHGLIETPIFMPVGTSASVKAVHMEEVKSVINAPIILANTYHLYLRPGTDILEKSGGLHRFMNWDRNILTDSGGYQVYSLGNNRKISEEGVLFQSHIDGSKHVISPEKAIEIQRKIGADFIMAFDECTPFPCDYNYAKNSVLLTERWLKRCKEYFDKSEGLYGHKQELIPIVQGSTYSDLRLMSVEKTLEVDAFAYAIGGLSVGEPEKELYDMTEIVCEQLPKEKPRYLMGVGTPVNILECISRGIDMFDCVMPTRNARHGILYTWSGTINIKNAKWKDDTSRIDSNSNFAGSRDHTKAYLRHLVSVNEMQGAQLASLHNLCFYLELVRTARAHILQGDFEEWIKKVIPGLKNRL